MIIQEPGFVKMVAVAMGSAEAQGAILSAPEIGVCTGIKAAISAHPVILAKLYFANQIGQSTIAWNHALATRLYFTPERSILFLAKDHCTAWTGQPILCNDAC